MTMGTRPKRCCRIWLGGWCCAMTWMVATLLMAWESARFVPIASPALIDEYQHVLAYPEIADMVYPELRRAFQSHLFDDIQEVVYDGSGINVRSHLCR